jgi:hypothetical protein
MNWLGRLFNLNPKLAIVVAVFVALFILAFVTKCHAEEAGGYAQISAGSAVVRGEAPVLDVGFTWPSGFRPGDFWKGDLTLIGTSSFKGEDVPNNFAVRGLYVAGFWHLDVGLGVSWMQNYLPYNGGPVNFCLELAYRFQRWPITINYTHMSDDGTKLPNYGRDLVMVGWRFGNVH